MGLKGVSHDVIDNSGRGDQLTVESTWEDGASKPSRSFSQRVYLQTLVLIIVLDFHSVFDEEGANVAWGLEIISVADLSSLRQMTVEGIVSCCSGLEDSVSHFFSVFIDINASEFVIEVISGHVQNLSNAVGRHHFAS